MSKRRNLKKEKAQRNKAYARKFRKQNTGRFSKNQSWRGGKKNQDQFDNQSEDFEKQE
ncbi:MAG TPA: hypothetical protein V6D28_08295 [Leptolyngbyaceae cyanobacterium]